MNNELIKLVEDAQNGDSESVLKIIQLFEPKIFKVIAQMNLNNKEDIEDCYSEIQIKIIEAIYKMNLGKMKKEISNMF